MLKHLDSCCCCVLVLALPLLSLLSPVIGLDLQTCTQQWVKTDAKSYLYKVDCSNRGFSSVPQKLPSVTSELLLNGNSISAVDHNAFAGLTSLHSADLSGNDIVYLDETVFRDTTELKYLDLSDNKLFCDWRIWWLVSYAKKLEKFSGECFNPRALRGRSITTLKEEELAVDCQSVKKMTGASSDGEYEMRVFAHDNSINKVFIYCHEMESDNPSEFLALPSGKERNYVSVYPDDTCNYSDELQETLEDMNKTVHFSYVKINLNKLWLVANDTTMNPLSQLTFGKPTICDSGTCVNGVASVDLRGTHFRLKGSKITRRVFSCQQQCGTCSFPNYLALDLVNSRKHPFSACTLPIGMQSKEIPDSAITSSSSAGKYYKESSARLNSIEHSGWCAGLKNDKQYLIVDLGKAMTISGIATQGHKKQQFWVTTYKLYYSDDGETYKEYSNVVGENQFVGNYDRYSVVTHWFRPRFIARFVKVQPLTWYNQESRDAKICLRLELYGCKSDINSYIIQPITGTKCFAIGDEANEVNGEKQYPLIKKAGCKGPEFMFTFHQRKIMHTKTGLCLHINGMFGLIFNTSCHQSSMMFQKVAFGTEESFLVKDYNGACARLFESQNSNLHAIWRKCKGGGFSIMKMTREGVSAFQPLFDDEEATVTTDLFVPLNLSCKARAEPLPIYEWSRDTSMRDDQTKSFQLSQNTTTHNGRTLLMIRNVTWSHRGVYFCNAWNSEGYNFKKYNLVVNPIQWFHEVPQNQRVIYGESTRFNCISKGIPEPTVSWLVYDETVLEYRNVLDVDAEKFTLLSNGTLVIKDVDYYDEKAYFCISSSPGLVKNVSATLDVYVTQEFSIKPTPQRVLYETDTILDCVSKGKPTPSINWAFAFDNTDEIVSIDDSLQNTYQLFQNGSLLVKSPRLKAQGRYYCISKSPGLTRNVSSTLSVYVTQRFHIEPQSSKILYSSNYTVQCESVGTPTPNITWMFQGKSDKKPVPLTQRTNGKVTRRSDGNLLITNAGYEEAGEYFCVSHSPGLSRNLSGVIDVYVTQNFTQKPESQIVLEKTYMVSFSCISAGVPPPSVSWMFQKSGSKTLLRLEEFEDERRQVIPGNDLVIRDVRDEDEGVYVCVSKSPGLVVNATATLTVHKPPEVIVPRSNVSKFSGESVKITCVSYGDPQPTNKWYKMSGTDKIIIATSPQSTGSSPRIIVENDMLTINQIVKGDEGNYVCEATNVAGQASKLVHLNVTVRCLIDIKNGSLTPDLKAFEEGGKVDIGCMGGFKLNGMSSLVCTDTGLFDNPTPTCDDVDECTDASESNNVSPVCDINAKCRNTIGSYECVCDEGYMMVADKCVYSPSGSGSSNPGNGNQPEPVATPPPKQDYMWFYDMIAQYKGDLIEEEEYLRKLLNFAKNITHLQYGLWREDALSNIAKYALNITIIKNKRNPLPVDPSARTKIKLFATIVSTLLEDEFVAEWKNVNKKTCGTICLMKYLEDYLMTMVPKMSTKPDDLQMSFKNIDIKLLKVNDTFRIADMKLSMMNRDSKNENTLRMPSENYNLLKGSTSIGILYKTMQKLLPTPLLAGMDSAELLTEIFSVSFTTLRSSQTLLEPAQIIFKFKEKPSQEIEESVCSFWDFKKDKHGGWSTDGCRKLNTSSSREIACQCDHLTNFAVLVPKASVKMIYLTLSLAVAVCVGFCILVAFITCMSHVCCSNYVNSDRQTILVNITLCIMLMLAIFAGAVFMSTMKIVPEKYSAYFCYTLMGTLQLFGCAFFAWTFAEAIHLYLSSRIVINKGNGRLLLFYFIGWVIPLCIVATTGVLVYFDKFQLQSRCVLNISLYLLSILIGAPVLLFILATFVVYILIRVNMASDKELLNARIITHTKGAMLCSFCLILLHVLVLGATAMFLRFNTQMLYHYILAAITAIEGLYLLFYHCYVDRKAGKSPSRQGSKNRSSYSTKETITYSPNGTSSNPEIAEEANEQKYLIKSSSKRLSKGEQTKPSPPQVRNIQQSDEAIEWDASYQGMYGTNNTNQSSQAEMKPLLSGSSQPDDDIGTPRTFRGGSFSKNSTLSKNGTFPRRWADSEDGNESVQSNQHRLPLKRSTSKGSSVLSIETHTSSNAAQGIPVYFPAAPPHYEMSLDRNKQDLHNINTYLESAETSRPTSFGIESDRVSNLSSELTNILYELQAFDTNRPPAEFHMRPIDHGSQTLPIRREPPITDISHNSTSTFKPSKKEYAKTEVVYDDSKPPSYSDHHRVRMLKGKNRHEADPADGLHTQNDSMYSSL